MQLPQGCSPPPKLGVIKLSYIQLGAFQSCKHHGVKGAEFSHDRFDEVPVSGLYGSSDCHSPPGYPMEDVHLCLDRFSRPLGTLGEAQEVLLPFIAEDIHEVGAGAEELRGPCSCSQCFISCSATEFCPFVSTMQSTLYIVLSFIMEKRPISPS